MTENFNKPWSEEEDNILKKMVPLGIYSFEEMGKILKRTTISCRSRSMRLNLFNIYRKKYYQHDENFWLAPNPINCYWAGFCAADGSIRIKGSLSSLRLEISKKDLNHLNKFKENTKFSGKISIANKKGHIFRNRWYDCSETCYLTIHDSKKWEQNLKENFGIIPNKTKRLQPPKLEDDFLKLCYIIGYTDGDGTITMSDKNFTFIVIKYTSSSINIVQWIKEILDGKFNKRLVNRGDVKILKMRDCNCYSYSISGIRALTMINCLKNFPVPKLARKWQQPKILEYLEQMKQKYPQFFTETLTVPPEWQNWDYKKHYNLPSEIEDNQKINLSFLPSSPIISCNDNLEILNKKLC